MFDLLGGETSTWQHNQYTLSPSSVVLFELIQRH